MERTIRITGKAKISARPDQTCIIMTCSGKDPDYDKVVEMSSTETERIKTALCSCGFDRKEIKTVSFDINTCFENRKTKNNDWERVFTGYEYSHELKVVFPMDNRRLSDIMQAISDSLVKPELQISYELSDPESVKNELLAKAVEDAGNKAQILCKAAHVQLMEIVQIDYSWAEVELHTTQMMRSMKTMKASSVAMEIEPEEITASDTVTVIYRIA